MSSLPVAAVLPELLTALDCAPQILLSAPTGAGKSTWLPLQLLAHPGINGKIILLEPRRLAARNVAQRLAELQYRGLMYHVAYEILHNEQDAEDAVHHAFVKIAENIKKNY